MAAATTIPRTYSFRQLEELWISAGGARQEAPTAAAIALAESGGNPSAHNASGATGLWQILGNPFPGNAYSPLTNARMAVAKNKAAKGWSPWETFTNGAYQQFLTPAYTKTGIKLGENVEPQAGLTGVLEGKIPGFSHEGKGEEAAEHVLENLGPPNWARLLINGVLLLAGAVLIIYGIMVAVGKSPSRVPIPVPV